LARSWAAGSSERVRASGESPGTFIERHVIGDWGELDEHDRRGNELSVVQGSG
jgi:hypothetical protein